MKRIGLVLTLMILGGCGTYHTLDELENQALLTGDWSEVERRERIIARRQGRSGLSCPSGLTRYCERWGADQRCTCIQTDDVQQMLIGWR
jgi:hypothetical protein